MEAVNPKYLIALGVVITLVMLLRVINPHRSYSTDAYWQDATIEKVHKVPAAALEPGNKNGSVLMWAAMNVSDPSLLAALVERGADVNESDPVFTGTPLSSAAAYSKYPEVIDELIRLGADINQLVSNGEDSLMVAAQYNVNEGIIERLIHHGADPTRINAQSKTALDLARAKKNTVAEAALQKYESH
ncbi:MAG: ankyrin repeat domain-containing protein [Gammaproteobacteria bacterium]